MKKLNRIFREWGALIALVVLFIASALRDPGVFLSPENLRNLLNQNAPVGMIAVGMTLVIISGGIDLSVGSIMALSAAVGIEVLNKLIPVQGEVMASMIAGVTCLALGTTLGAINGLMITKGRVAPFVATLVGMVAFRSVCVAMADAGEVRSASANVFPSFGTKGIPLPFVHISGGQPLVLYWGIFLFILVALLAGFVLNSTRLGRYIVAVGANEKAAHYSAINVNRVRFWVYCIIGFTTACAALTLSSRMNSVATSTMGNMIELDAIAAVVIGGTSLKGGYGRIWGTVAGVILLGIITNMLVVSGISAYWQGAVKGLIILAAVLIQRTSED